MTEDLWADDEHPAVATLERRLSDAGAQFLYAVHQDAMRTLGLPGVPAADVQAAYRTPHLPMAKAERDEQRRSGSRALLLFEQLLAQPAGARRASDLADATTQNWYAHGLLPDRASTLTARAAIIGHLQATGTVPDGAGEARARASIVDPDAQLALDWAGQHAAEYARGLKDRTRALLAGQVIDALLAGESAGTLSARLLTTFGTLNRDWRRFAITELAAARAHGYLLGLPDGAQVEWRAARDACPVCAGLDGQRFTVRKRPGDWRREVWAGKSNVGRAASPRRRDGTARGEAELAMPTIPMHPNCRCRYVRVARQFAGVSPALEAYIAALARQ